MEDTSHRIVWIDLARAAAAWMVVTAHLLRQGALADYLAALSVTMFFVLSGVTMHRQDSYVRYLQGRLRRIVLPYLAVGLVSIVLYRLLGSYAAAGLGTSMPQTTFPEDLWHLIYGSSVGGRMKWNESLWFLPCYLVAILLAQAGAQAVMYITPEAEDIYRPLRIYIVGGLCGYGLIAYGIVGLPWHLETALLILPLIGCGRVLRTLLEGKARHRWLTALAGAALLALGTGLFSLAEMQSAEGSFSLRAVHLGGLWESYGFLLLAGTGMIVLLWAIYSAGTEGTVLDGPVLPYVGAHSLDIVLWNKFPVLAVQVILPRLLPGVDDLFVGGMDARSLVMAALLAIPCMALCLLWTRIYRTAFARLHT